MYKKTLWQEITDHILGKKYYLNVVNVVGTDTIECTNIIHPTMESALEHKRRIETSLSFRHVEIISFRSKVNYG